MKKLICSILITTSFIFSHQAQAALMSMADPVFGVDSITLDTDTGLEWLDVTLSVNRSFLDVSGELGAGGDFEGFRYASVDDLLTLFTNAAIPNVNNYSAANVGPAQALAILLGATGFQDAFPETVGFTGTSNTPGTRVVALIDYVVSINGGVTTDVYGATATTNSDESMALLGDNGGSWLLRDASLPAPVPLPGAIWLFFSGMLAVFALRRQSA